eukprot:2462879-Pyramimonas_sp.AAC.1
MDGEGKAPREKPSSSSIVVPPSAASCSVFSPPTVWMTREGVARGVEARPQWPRVWSGEPPPVSNPFVVMECCGLNLPTPPFTLLGCEYTNLIRCSSTAH